MFVDNLDLQYVKHVNYYVLYIYTCISIHEASCFLTYIIVMKPIKADFSII